MVAAVCLLGFDVRLRVWSGLVWFGLIGTGVVWRAVLLVILILIRFDSIQFNSIQFNSIQFERDQQLDTHDVDRSREMGSPRECSTESRGLHVVFISTVICLLAAGSGCVIRQRCSVLARAIASSDRGIAFFSLNMIVHCRRGDGPPRPAMRAPREL
jgi:hypothetical protein